MANVVKSEKQLLEELDAMEESIKLLDLLDEKYKALKSKLKASMVKVAKENNLEQIKWITPNGTSVTCSVGHCAEIEKKPTKKFNEEKLKKEYPHIYEECCEDIQESVIVKNATSDTLRVTFSKENN